MLLSRYQDRHDISYIRALGLLLLFAASHSKCIAILGARSWGSIALRRDRCTIVALCGIAAICTINSKFKVQRSWPCLSRQNKFFMHMCFCIISMAYLIQLSPRPTFGFQNLNVFGTQISIPHARAMSVQKPRWFKMTAWICPT